MKITLIQDPSLPETEVLIRCPQADEEVLRLVAMLRIHQKKLVGVLDGTQHLLDIREILYADTVDKRTFLYTRQAVYTSALRLYELEEGLRDQEFLRVSRAALINFRHVRAIRPELGGRMLVTMDNGEQVCVSRQYAGAIREKLRAVERSLAK